METKQAEQKNMDNHNNPLPGQTGGRFSPRNIRLQTRLVVLTLAIAVPFIALTFLILPLRAEEFLRQQTNERLAQENNGLYIKTETWIDMNVSLLKQMAGFDDIGSMDPGRQRPLLIQTAQAFPYIYLAHTLDTAGFNVARNDGQANRDYSHREYYQGVMKGEPVSYQVVIGATNNLPALIMAAPIKSSDQVIGVISIACELDSISQEVLKSNPVSLKNQFVTFIVDQKGYVVAHPDEKVAHPDPKVVEGGLTNYTSYPPVSALREGTRGLYEFTDENGHRWIAFLSQLENGWGIITQQETSVAFAAIRQFQFVTIIMIAIEGILLAILVPVSVRRSLRPLANLRETVRAMTAGDLNQVASVERNDEVGQLAQAFNLLTDRLRENIANLEQRVQDRTRAMMLSTDVSRRISTILNMDQLTREVVNEVQHTFDYYHVHIYLFDESRQNLVMAGGTGEAGQVMLARKHRIPAGRGLVGRAAETNAPVLVSDTSQDPGWLPNPLLPETRSELAVPISIKDTVLGVLDVQQNVVNGLTEVDVDLIRLTANQVAIALQNAITYEQAQQRAERENARRQKRGRSRAAKERILADKAHRAARKEARRPTRGEPES